MTDDSRADLNRLERKEWLRWSLALFICGVLSATIYSFSLPALKRTFSEQVQLEIAVTGLFGMVGVFAVFTIYQQVRIVRLRRELLTGVAMTAALDMLKPPQPEDLAGREQVREYERYHFDVLLKVIALIEGREQVIFGRTSDISEGGLGAVISHPLPRRKTVKLEFEVLIGTRIVVEGVVLHQRGFHHGFMFLDITAEQRAAIRRACAGAPVFGPWQPVA